MQNPDFSGKSILIVDDLEDNLFLLTKILELTGANIIKAKSGLAAIQAISENPGIDIVLMDIKMPGMDGFIATSEIHKLRPEMPVIAQTAFAMKDDEEKALASGCIEYVSKPISRLDLYEKLAKHL
jgi:two-component system sensor histidine kinase/response regulator